MVGTGLAVGGGWQLAAVGGWQLVVLMGLSLRAVLNKKKSSQGQPCHEDGW